ncbi:MAG: hypothetical protein ACYDCB_12285, partial [Candidatus Dormibacteria bacterium]
MAGPLLSDRASTHSNAARLRALGFEGFVPRRLSPLPCSQGRPVREGEGPGLVAQPAASGIFGQDNMGLLRVNAVA